MWACRGSAGEAHGDRGPRAVRVDRRASRQASCNQGPHPAVAVFKSHHWVKKAARSLAALSCSSVGCSPMCRILSPALFRPPGIDRRCLPAAPGPSRNSGPRRPPPLLDRMLAFVSADAAPPIQGRAARLPATALPAFVSQAHQGLLKPF